MGDTLKFKTLFFWSAAVLITAFHFNNFFQYQPEWGFDGKAHMYLIQYVAKYFEFPKPDVYGASNPPLYYFFSAIIYNASGHSFKVVQFFSLLMSAANVFMLWRCLNYFSKNDFFKGCILIFFSLLPLHLHYFTMVFNYALANFLAIATLWAVIYFIHHHETGWRPALVLGVLSNLSVLTSISNVAIWCACFFCLLFYPSKEWKKKAVGLIVFILVTLAVTGPYYQDKKKKFGSFFSAKHRHSVPMKREKGEGVYPKKFYTHFALDSFHKPYHPNFLQEGLWIILYQTLYSDYYNYQVDADHSENRREAKADIETGRHFISQQRIQNLMILNYLALPVALVFLIVFLGYCKETTLFLMGWKKDLFIGAVSLVLLGLLSAQFLKYIWKYAEYVNISAGYFFPAVFMICVSMARYFKKPVWVYPISASLLAYSAWSGWTFIKL